MELQISYRVCAEVSEKSLLRAEAIRDWADIAGTMQMERREHIGGRSLPGSHSYVGGNPPENERVKLYGVPEGKEQLDDL